MTSTIVRTLAASIFLATLSVAPVQAQTHEHPGHDMPASGMPKMDHGKMDHGSTNHDGMMTMRATHMVEARGSLVALNRETREATIRHDAIPAVSWPAAQMVFPVSNGVDLKTLAPGQAVQFTLHRAADGSLPLVELCSAQGNGITPGLCASGMNHETMNHGQMDHSKMDHSAMPHGAMSHGDSHASGTDAATPSDAHRHDANE